MPLITKILDKEKAPKGFFILQLTYNNRLLERKIADSYCF